MQPDLTIMLRASLLRSPRWWIAPHRRWDKVRSEGQLSYICLRSCPCTLVTHESSTALSSISYASASSGSMHACCMLSCFSGVWLFVTLWTVKLQAPLSMGLSRQEQRSGCHALHQGFFLTQGSKLGLRHCRQILYHLSYQGSHRSE